MGNAVTARDVPEQRGHLTVGRVVTVDLSGRSVWHSGRWPVGREGGDEGELAGGGGKEGLCQCGA